MAKYFYKARNREGLLVDGYLDVSSEEEASAGLHALGYSILLLESKAEFTSLDLSVFQKGVPLRNIVFFARQLGTLLKAGVPIIEALESIRKQTQHKLFAETISDLLDKLRRGISCSDAMSEHRKVFPELLVSMVRVGESGGLLHVSLDRFAKLKMEEMEIKAKVHAVMVYPAVLVVASILISAFLIVYILPKFTAMFDTYQMELPLPTQIVLGVSYTIRKFWFVLIIAIGAGGYWLSELFRTAQGKYHLHLLLLKMPVFKDLYLKAVLFPFFSTLAELLSLGVPLFDALSVTAKTIPNVVLRKAVEDARLVISEGSSFSEALGAGGFFPPTVIQMVGVGEKSGEMGLMLEEISFFYEKEVGYAIRNLTTVLEPLLLIIMGLSVGFIALSILLPIFNMIKIFKG